MTAADPAPDHGLDADALRLAARWCARLANDLAAVGRRVGLLSEEIGTDWPDAGGREVAERTARLHRELGREAVAAAELGESYAQDLARLALPATGLPGIALPGTGTGRRGGPRLGGTEAARVDDERGMRIAELPEPGTEPGTAHG